MFPRIAGISNSCQTNPCLNGGTCQGNAKDWSYNCICTEGFWGDNCENGECLTLCSVFGKHVPNTAVSPRSWPLRVIRGRDVCNSAPQNFILMTQICPKSGERELIGGCGNYILSGILYEWKTKDKKSQGQPKTQQIKIHWKVLRIPNKGF